MRLQKEIGSEPIVLLIERRIKNPEIIRMGKKILLRLELMKQQMGELCYDKPDRNGRS